MAAPRTIGAICPSGKALSNALVNMALEKTRGKDGVIVDLGAGTGVVTRELLQRGFLPKYVLALDISRSFTPVFNRNCPSARLYVGDARNLRKIVADIYPHLPVLAIISSLPLKVMPASLVVPIMAELLRLLSEHDGVLVQYTYALWLRSALVKYGFTLQSRKLIASNLPPCLVERYTPNK